MGRFTGFLGLAVILGVAWLFSTHKKEIKLRLILWGMGLQFAFALLVLKTDFGKIFQAASTGVNAMLKFAEEGSKFLFGDKLGAASDQFGVIFAFQVLPIVIFIASFFSILYYLGVMQVVVKAMAIAMQKIMGVSGAESLDVAASIFMGQTEAPLTIKPFLAGLTESELFTIMTAGMAHVSGAVMAAYVKVAGVSIIHLLTAVIMTAPATIMLAKIFIPETEKPVTAGRVDIKVEKTAVNVIDAAAQGAGDGLHLALNIGGMLIAFLALIAMCNGILGWIHTLPLMGWLPASLERIFGIVFAPVAFLLGVPWKDCGVIGDLLGTRLVLNEFVAFLKLGPLKSQLDPRSFTIATYALCGFANFSSIAIQIGGIGALAPTRKSDLARLGLRAVAAGTMANFMSACIAGMLL
jgi:CNT family concentrative nucleoside transporter